MYKNVLLLPDGTEVSSGTGTKNAIKSVKSTQMVNSGEELTIGSACSNMIEASIFTPSGDLNITAGDQLIHYKEDSNGNRTKIGVYTVEGPTRPTPNTMKIVGYDRVAKLDKDLTSWLKALTGWPYTVQSFTAMVCEACGVTYVPQDGLPNADFPIREWMKTGATGRQIMRWLGEIVCRYVYADQDGNIRFGWYKDSGKSYAPSGKDYFMAGSLSYENYQVAPVEAVQIRLADNDSGAVWPQLPNGTNAYVITGNPILTAYVTEALLPYLDVIAAELARVTYTPCEVSVLTSTEVNTGDIVRITDKNGKTFSTYVMSKITSGQRDTISCTGSQRRDSSAAANNKTEAEKMADAEAAANTSANKAQSVAEEKVKALDDSLDQNEVFNRLTNDGALQGLYMKDGKLYINSSYIVTGILKSKDGDTFYLDLDNGVLKGKFEELSISGKTVDTIAQEKANKAEGNAKTYADTAASNAVERQTQTDIFNKLTNNGALPGLFMLNGQMYVNADYLATGVISSKSGTIAVDLSGDTFKVNMSDTKSMEFGASGLFGILDGTQVLSLFQSVWASVPTAGIFSLNGADLQIDAAASDESAAGKVKLASSGTTLQIKGKTVSWKDNGDGTFTLIGR